MLKTKNLVILAVVLVVLAGINFMQKSSHKKATSGSAVEVVLAGEFQKENLGRITLGFGPDKEAVVMSTSPAGWLIDTAFGSAANGERIDTMLRSLSNLAGEYRSDKESVLDQYGLDEAGSVKIRAYDKSGAEVLAVDVGKTPERFPGQFVRLPGSNKVFLSQKSVLGSLGVYGPPALPTSKYFLDLQAVKEDRLEVDRIVLRDGDGTVDLVKEFAMNPVPEGSPQGTEPTIDRMTWEWKLNQDGGAALAKTKVDGVLGAVVSIRAGDVADPGVADADYGLDAPVRTATIYLQDGTERVLEFGASRPAEGTVTAGTYMKVQGEPTVWVVTEYTTRNIFKKVEDLMP
jgi:hypothetical protein